MIDMTKAIVIKTDQLNADDLISGPRTIKVRDIKLKDSGEQRAHIFFDGDNGKPYKPNTSMLKILCAIWGKNGTQWIGRSMTLFNDKTVKWAGQAVGGIRISHMSHIEAKQTHVIAVSRGVKKPYTVLPLQSEPQQSQSGEHALSDAKAAARLGKDAFTNWWQTNKHLRDSVRPHLSELEAMSASADNISVDNDNPDKEEPFA